MGRETMNFADMTVPELVATIAQAYSESTGKPATTGMHERIAGTLYDACKTGFIETGAQSSIAFFAAIVAGEYEAMMRQVEYQKAYFERKDARGYVKNDYRG